MIRSSDQEGNHRKGTSYEKVNRPICHVDDFCQAFLPQWQKLQLESGERKRNRKGRLSESEFPALLSYTRFLEVMPSVLVPLSSFFTHVKEDPTGIKFIDSTSIKVCHHSTLPILKSRA